MGSHLVWNFGLRAEGFEFDFRIRFTRVSRFAFRVSYVEFRVSCFGLREWSAGWREGGSLLGSRGSRIWSACPTARASGCTSLADT